MAAKRDRVVDLIIYFSESPAPLTITDVCHFGTEGGLLRVIHKKGDTLESQWWPLLKVFNIREIARRDTD